MNIEKAIISQDFLYDYLVKHNVNLSRLNELMGVSNGILMGSFHHDTDRHGNQLKFSAKNVERLNVALEELAAQMRQCVITFGSSKTYTNKRGTEYDPGTVPQIKALVRWFKLNPFCERVLGWNLNKKETVLYAKSSKAFGTVSAEHVAKINAEVLAVAGMLGGIEVEMPEADSN